MTPTEVNADMSWAGYLVESGQPKPKNTTGPVKWCRRCSRHHGSRVPCDLVRVTRVAKSGRSVERLTHGHTAATSPWNP